MFAVSSFFQPWPPTREFKEQTLLNEEIKELNALVLSMNEERIFIVKKIVEFNSLCKYFDDNDSGVSYHQMLEFSELRTDLISHLDNYPVFENSECFELEYLHIKRNECIDHHNTVVSAAEEFLKRANELQNQAWLNERARNSALLKNSFMESMDTEVSSRTNDVSENKSSPRLQ